MKPDSVSEGAPGRTDTIGSQIREGIDGNQPQGIDRDVPFKGSPYELPQGDCLPIPLRRKYQDGRSKLFGFGFNDCGADKEAVGPVSGQPIWIRRLAAAVAAKAAPLTPTAAAVRRSRRAAVGLGLANLGSGGVRRDVPPRACSCAILMT